METLISEVFLKKASTVLKFDKKFSILRSTIVEKSMFEIYDFSVHVKISSTQYFSLKIS